MDAFGRGGCVHVRQVFAEELVDVAACGIVPVNGNHRLKSTCWRCRLHDATSHVPFPVNDGDLHVDLYDRVGLIPFDKLTDFFRTQL
jgi:hypothetical protein